MGNYDIDPYGHHPEIPLGHTKWIVLACLVAACLGFAVSAQCQERTSPTFKLTAAAMVGLGAVDIVQTQTALHSGQFREGNPAMQPFVSSPWAMASVKAGVFAATFTAAHNLKRNGHDKAAWAVLLSVTAAQGFAVAWNAHQFAGVRR